MGIVQKQQVSTMGQGNGYMRFGATNLNMRDAGSLEGATTEVTTREVLQAFDGQPALLVKEEVVKEMARITASLKEKTLRLLCIQMGITESEIDDTYITEATVEVVGERKYLYDPDSWAHLNYNNILKSPAPVVMSDDATPVALDEYNSVTGLGDYVIYKGAIRRVSTGAIAYGSYVDIDYSAVRGATQGVHLGGLNTKEYIRLDFTYEQQLDSHYPQSGGRQITVYPQAYPSPEMQQAYNSGAWNIREISFDALGDLTLPEGQRLRQQWFEAKMAGTDLCY